MSDGGDHAVDEFQSVVGSLERRLIGETRAVKSAIEPLTAAVAGEHATRSIGPVSGGCETDDEKSRIRVTEIGNWSAPVIPFGEGFSFFRGDRPTVSDQTRAVFTVNNVAIEPGAGIVRHG